MVSMFRNGLEHWKSPNPEQSRLYFIVSCWLQGRIPPPRCQAHIAAAAAANILCLEEAALNQNYCDMFHNCKADFNTMHESTRRRF